MKPTKIRNYQIYRAPYAIKSNQVSSPLSEELRKKYRKRSIRVVVDDSVRIIRGEYKGIDGKVTKVSIMKNSIAIEGIKREKLKGEKTDVYIPSFNGNWEMGINSFHFYGIPFIHTFTKFVY